MPRPAPRRLVLYLTLASFPLLLHPLLHSSAAQRARADQAKPRRLGADMRLERDASSDDLRLVPRQSVPGAAPAAGEEAPTLRVRVSLVEISCNVLRPDGTDWRGLQRDDFAILENGVPQEIAHFDAAAEPAGILLLFDASPSVLRDVDEMKAAARALAGALDPQDEIAVAAFAGEAFLLQRFTRDRAALERAIERVNVDRLDGAAPGSNIYRAVFLAAKEVFAARRGRKAIVLLTDGQDSSLGLDWTPESGGIVAAIQARQLRFEDVARALAAAGIEVHAVSTQPRPKLMTDAFFEVMAGETWIAPKIREGGVPHYTAWLGELVRRAGGRLYFLRDAATLGELYRRIAAGIHAQYTLGYYSSRAASAGWRSVRVLTPQAPGARLLHRPGYYVFAQPSAN